MIKFIVTLTLLLGTLFADTTITLQKGWQFVGFPSDIDDINTFNRPEVDILWGYDGATQSWLGYAPDKERQTKINKRYNPLTKIDAWQGVWIHNKKEWSLTRKEQQTTSRDISLFKGWNLISLPNDMTLSPHIFKDDILWKYHDNAWQLFTADNDTKTIAPPISKIESAEAIWVKSTHAHQVALSSDASALHTFSSREEMKHYIQQMLLDAKIPRYYDKVVAIDEAILEDGVVGAPAVANDAAQAKATDATGTNLQEDDVDESDILKHDGEHIFFYNRAKNRIQITNFTNLTAKQNSTIAPITLPVDTFVEAMFIHESRLIMITNQQRYYYAQKMDIAIEPFMPQKTEEINFEVRIYDISDINTIQELSTTTIDGTFQNSRIIGDALYIISQFSPHIEVEYPHIYIDEKTCQKRPISVLSYQEGRYINTCNDIYHDNKGYYRYDYSKPTIKKENLIPTINKGERDLITPDTFYAPCKLNQFPTITTISQFDIPTQSFKKSTSLVANTNKLYASSKSIYLTSTEYPYYYDFKNFKEREMIYKFSLGDDFDYQAKGFVEGVMLDQFSMSEKDDTLRVATTTGDGWRGETNNFVFTLAQKEKMLQIQGELKGLGHKGERIRGVRFLGDRGYVVTFRQSDPFYTLDLSNPSNPSKIGELNVTGFSSYIHPVDENYILTLGRDASPEGRVGGFKVSLYDISDFAHPKKADERIYARSLYNFDAEYNHQAFIYRKSDKRFAITYHDNKTSHMDVFQIDAGHINSSDRLSIETNAYESRGIIFNLNTRIYSTLFSGDAINTKALGAAQ